MTQDETADEPREPGERHATAPETGAPPIDAPDGGEPDTDEPVGDDPGTDELSTEDPGTDELSTEDPGTDGLGTDEPAEEQAPAAEGVAGDERADESSAPARPPLDGRGRLRKALWPPRLSRGQLVVALLLFALGLGLAIQVRSTNDHSALRGARQEDLVRILDELDSRQQRLQQEKGQLDQSLTQLENSSNQAKEAQEQTRQKALELGVLAGTVKASGPGIVLTVDDPQGQVKADMLLDTLQELRAAGAEAIQINDVRVVAHTYFTDLPSGGVAIDGKKVAQPYRFTVIGSPQDLTPALNIPGGIVRTLEKEQVGTNISEQQKLTVDALAAPGSAQFAKPAAK
ncbi:DUF881 domain-containing protein [Kitasatospora sp. NBC_01250]|uniref:DUF881 domain-containing protein n=1 Tax=Kitasatospora sp. NBC_01250 TaxID=2903571 RepID=UPI002E307A28|nr:DUF881 domain-containing protein [Kitasatospora sp. NBC_01250]